MIQESKDLASLIYAYRFDHAMPLRELATTMAKHIEEFNTKNKTDLKTFSIRSLSFHFNKHVPSNLQSQYQIQNRMNQTVNSAKERAVTDLVQSQVNDQVKRSVSTFDEMIDLFEKLKKLFDEYSQSHQTITPLSIHLDLMREMRKTLVELSKMKQSKELIKIAVRSVIDTFLGAVIKDMGSSIDSLRDQLVKKTKDPMGVDTMLRDFRKDMVDATVAAARTAVDRVRVEFALEDKE
jgi:ribosomal protein S3AE